MPNQGSIFSSPTFLYSLSASATTFSFAPICSHTSIYRWRSTCVKEIRIFLEGFDLVATVSCSQTKVEAYSPSGVIFYSCLFANSTTLRLRSFGRIFLSLRIGIGEGIGKSYLARLERERVVRVNTVVWHEIETPFLPMKIIFFVFFSLKILNWN